MIGNKLKRIHRVIYKTAWYLCHRIRHAMTEANAAKLTGTVEVDETYVGGNPKRGVQGYKGNKTMVMAAIQRGGAIRMTSGHRPSKAELHGFVRANIADECMNIYTDEAPGYKGIAD